MGRVRQVAPRAGLGMALVLITLAINTSEATEWSSSCTAKTRVVSDLCSAFGEQTPACASSRTQLAAGCKTADLADGTSLGDTSVARSGVQGHACQGVPDPYKAKNAAKKMEARFSAKCMVQNAKNAGKLKACKTQCQKKCNRQDKKCERECNTKCFSDYQCYQGKYKAVRPIKTFKLATMWMMRILGSFHFAVCPMEKNSAVGKGKCCLGINMDTKNTVGTGNKIPTSNCASQCINDAKTFKTPQCAAWQSGKKGKTEDTLFGNLLGEDGTFFGRRRKSSSRRRAGRYMKAIKRAAKAVKKVKKAANKVKNAAKKTVKKGVALAKKTVKKGLSGAMGTMLKKLLSMLPKGIRPLVSDAISTYSKTKSISKTLLKVLPLAVKPLLKLVPKDIQPAVQTAITTFLQTKSISKTIGAVWSKTSTKEGLNSLFMKYFARKMWLMLGTNPCSVDCLCHNVLDPFLNARMTLKVDVKGDRWRGAKPGTQEHDFHKMAEKFKYSYLPKEDRGTVVFNREALNDIPEMKNRQTGKGVKKGQLLCQGRFNILTAICETCCCKHGKVFVTVGSTLSIQRVDACTGWFQLIDQIVRSTVNIMASVNRVDIQNRCSADYFRLTH